MSELDDQLPRGSGDEDQVDVDDIVRQHENNSESEEDAETTQLQVVTNDSMDEVNVPDGDDEDAAGASVPVKPKKRVVRKLVVLNTERLKGRKGVHTIEKLYQGFKFHGKGHEAEDLEKIMKRLEYWAFRLFPKLEFDDFLAKCETLGHKKDLHTHLKKYKTGMIDADYGGIEDYTQDDIIENENDEDEQTADAAAVARQERALLDQIADENFERLLAETVDMPTE